MIRKRRVTPGNVVPEVSVGTRVALTIDTEHPDQANCPPDAFDRLLDALREAAVTATFFIQGRWALAYPDRARLIADEGHLVANHSHFHFPASRLTPSVLEADILEAEQAIVETTGVNPRPWFRLPFFNGQDNAWVRATIQQLGYTAVGSNVDSGDWDASATERTLRDALLAGAARNDPAVAVLHSWPTVTASGMAAAIARLQDVQARFISVAELASDELAACDPLAPSAVNTTVS